MSTATPPRHRRQHPRQARSPTPRRGRAGTAQEPITWFPPMWAFACGVVSSGVPILEHWTTALLAVVLAGPPVCA